MLASLVINKSFLTGANIQVSIYAKKHERVVSEMLDHLEVSLLEPSPWLPAPAGAISFATAGEGGRVLQYVAAHDMNAVACTYDYSSRENY